MTQFVLNRDRRVASLSGHVIVFKKDVPVHVPAAAHQDVLAIGAAPVDGEAVVPDENGPAQIPAEALDAEKRKAAIIAAFETLVARNARGDFDAAGKPHPKAVSGVVGFQVEVKERNALWAEFLNKDE